MKRKRSKDKLVTYDFGHKQYSIAHINPNETWGIADLFDNRADAVKLARALQHAGKKVYIGRHEGMPLPYMVYVKDK